MIKEAAFVVYFLKNYVNFCAITSKSIRFSIFSTYLMKKKDCVKNNHFQS